MPKIVDHGARREEIAAALFRVVRRHGIHATSVRTVAAEAGTSPSALRHYFASQDELLAFALRATVDRVRARLQPLLPDLSGRAGALTVLEELLPLDATRRGETEVYIAFVTRAQPDPGLRRIRDAAETASRQAVQVAIGLLADGGHLGAGRDRVAEADRTYAVVDGLALHGTLWPRRHPATRLRTVLRQHVDELGTDR